MIPVLNEEEAVEEVVQGFPEEYRGRELDIFVIDGGSTDSTVEKAEDAGATVLEQRLSGGKGNGVKEALAEVEADIYVMIDGDGTYDPGEVGRLLDPLIDGEAEHVVGRRVERDPGSIPRLNRVGNSLFNWVTRLSTGKEIHDMLSGYRAFTRYSLDFTDLTRPGFGIETEMTFSAVENHVPIREVEISYREREGESKLHPLSDGWRIINTIIWSIRDMNPLKFFSTASIVFFLLAVYPLYLTAHQYLIYGRIQDTAPGLLAGVLVIIGIQLMILGMLSDQVKSLEKRLKEQER
ncbi:MAG: glycosyltransferase [Candidatus Nanohaloarchaea archaeon]